VKPLAHLAASCALGLLCVDAGAAALIEQRGVAPITGDAAAGEAKAAVCMACHGPEGNPVVPTFPRLAGQRADYLYWELVKYKTANRADSPMTAQVANLTVTDMRNLAAYFASRKRTSTNATSASSNDAGKELFEHGRAASGIPACQGCHGANADGGIGDAQRAYPALRAQQASFIEQRLKDYRAGKLEVSSNDMIMMGVAASLDDQAIASLAQYLASLPAN
jgi:cytochrome c553